MRSQEKTPQKSPVEKTPHIIFRLVEKTPQLYKGLKIEYRVGSEYKLNKNIGLNRKGVSSTSIENRLRGWNTS